MKNKLGFALCLLLVAVFMGCKEDEEGKHHFSNQVFISATSFTDDVFIKRDNLDVTREESCDVTVAMAQPRERDITVTFAEAPGLLEHYRMFYDDPTAELLPANGGYYDFADNSTVITAGMVESVGRRHEYPRKRPDGLLRLLEGRAHQRRGRDGEQLRLARVDG